MALLHEPPGVKKKSSSPAKGVLLEDLGNTDLLVACRRLQDLWGLDSETASNLLGTSRSTWFRWLEAQKGGKDIQWTGDQRARALALLRIFEAVADLHHEDRDAHSWIHEALEAPGFSGRTPLEVMASGFEGLLLVRDYLNFLHSAWT
jgi:uncharacterized protein (DUF2384 family)